MTTGVLARREVQAAALFLLLAFGVRAIQFGNPLIQGDEQFYLLVGERMHHGALPYADLWDRKQIGLFLIYWFAAFFADGVLAYQLLAALCAAGTAGMIALLAARIAPWRGALWSGAIYLIFLMLFGGDGGQSPVFYNLLTACAAWFVVRAIGQPRFGRTLFALGCAAMAVAGLALQVKYSVLLEGVYFGLVLMALAWRGGAGPARLIAAAAMWAALALVPTGIAIAAFAAIGHADAFVFANFQSIFLRGTPEGDALSKRVIKIVVRIAPLAGAAAASLLLPAGDAPRDLRRFFAGWAGVAALSVLIFGTYHDHYALPLLLPFAIVAAPVFALDRAVPGTRLRLAPAAMIVALFGIVLGWSSVTGTRAWRGTAPDLTAMAAQVRLDPGRCLFVFSGDSALYSATRSCLPTRYSFPTFLSESREGPSLGIDVQAELRCVMAGRPQYVATRDNYPFPEAEPESWAFMKRELDRDYHLIFRQRAGDHHRLLYRRRD